MPSASLVISFIDLIEIDKFIPIKLINFLRSISEFESLHVQDRLVLVKYNFISLLLLRDALVYDTGSILLSSIDLLNIYTSLCVLFYVYY